MLEINLAHIYLRYNTVFCRSNNPPIVWVQQCILQLRHGLTSTLCRLLRELHFSVHRSSRYSTVRPWLICRERAHVGCRLELSWGQLPTKFNYILLGSLCISRPVMAGRMDACRPSRLAAGLAGLTSYGMVDGEWLTGWWVASSTCGWTNGQK